MTGNENVGTVTKRDAILRSAYTVFTEKGFHSARVSEIAKLAKVGKGTVYEYFSSKEDLLRGVIEAGIRYYMDEIIKTGEAIHNPWEKIKSIIRRHAQIQREHQNISELIFNNFGIMDAEFHEFLQLQRQDLINKLEQLITSSVEEKLIKPINPTIGARILLGNIMATNCDIGCLEGSELEQLIDVLENGFVR